MYLCNVKRGKATPYDSGQNKTYKTMEADNILKLMRETNERVLSVCQKQIHQLTHPAIYGAYKCNCNCIVINKARLMTIKIDEQNKTTYEFQPLYPTYFTLEQAKRILSDDRYHPTYYDRDGNLLSLEIIGKLEYYQLLKEHTEKKLISIQTLFG